MGAILFDHPGGAIVLVGGWTGKGVIAREMAACVRALNQERGCGMPEGLAVLSDPAGIAAMAAGTDDCLIPSCLLNSVVSGLISQTISAPGLIGPDDFHGWLFYRELAPWDFSKWLVAAVTSWVDLEAAAEASQAFMAAAMAGLGVSCPNLVKPGLGEATRVLLRRGPERVMVRDPGDTDCRHLLVLAGRRKVTVEAAPALPCRAAAVIRGQTP